MLKRILFAAMLCTACVGYAAEETQEVDMKKLSEAFGNFLGRNLKSPGLNLNIDDVIKGLRDGFAGKPSPMTDKEYEEAMANLQIAAYQKVSEENLTAANDFLRDNATKPNIVVVEPGKLQYTIMKSGQGATVEEHFSPLINYTGSYIDGTVFGSSEDTGGPITISLDQTIAGFAKGLVGMKEGETRKIFIHPDLGYGTSGHLPPNALLIFEVEIVKANTPDEDAASEA